MAFIVINAVKASKDELPGILMNVQRLGLEALRTQPGFRFARLMVSEDGTEAKLIIEWDSRDAFVAYRQGATGRHMIEGAAQLHPHIEFYEVVAAYG